MKEAGVWGLFTCILAGLSPRVWETMYRISFSLSLALLRHRPFQSSGNFGGDKGYKDRLLTFQTAQKSNLFVGVSLWKAVVVFWDSRSQGEVSISGKVCEDTWWCTKRSMMVGLDVRL